MTLISTLICAAALTTLGVTIRVNPDDPTQRLPQAPPNADSYQPQGLPLHLELPRDEQPVPFYPEEPLTYMRPPQPVREDQPDFYRVPIPSDDLTAPAEGLWNPDNDPKLYYELPAVVTKEALPTNNFPKKFNKDIHAKSKPFASKPKQEVVLEAINEQQYVARQKELQKTFQKLAKKENAKRIQSEKVANRQKGRVLVVTPPSVDSHARRLKNHRIEAASTTTENDRETVDGSRGDVLKAQASHNGRNLPAYLRAPAGERLGFHMEGHDGPMSYKWGFDTGKGKNRHFRFEERDKDGIVKGHYGYYDRDGKLKMMGYDSHPQHGFHAQPIEGFDRR